MSWSLRMAAATLAILAVPCRAAALESAECSRSITRSNLASCVLSAHPELLVERSQLPALLARRSSASTLLPSNPVLAVNGSQRSSSEPGGRKALEWSASLSQELELAGGRGRRVRAAEAEIDAQRERLRASERAAVAAGWVAFFQLLAARAELELSERLLATSERMSRVARAKAERGLLAVVEADVVSSATLQVLHAKLDAEQALAVAGAELSYVLGRDPAAPLPAVEGALTPLSEASAPGPLALAATPELRALTAERRALGERAAALRRERVPNPTLSVFAQRDGFDERVLGVGLSLPIPLPAPLGQTRAGEIAELEALARRTDQQRKQAEARARLNVAIAAAAVRTHRQFVEALPPAALERAEQSMRLLGAELEAGRLTVREALNAQQALIDLLRTHVAERRALCLASIDLALAQGAPLERGTP